MSYGGNDVDASYPSKLYTGIVKSAIVYDEKLSNSDKMRKIIEKYILEGSEYELNIPYR